MHIIAQARLHDMQHDLGEARNTPHNALGFTPIRAKSHRQNKGKSEKRAGA
jgi:hypothetical protein